MLKKEGKNQISTFVNASCLETVRLAATQKRDPYENFQNFLKTNKITALFYENLQIFIALELTVFRPFAYALGKIAVQLGAFFKKFPSVGRVGRLIFFF